MVLERRVFCDCKREKWPNGGATSSSSYFSLCVSRIYMILNFPVRIPAKGKYLRPAFLFRTCSWLMLTKIIYNSPELHAAGRAQKWLNFLAASIATKYPFPGKRASTLLLFPAVKFQQPILAGAPSPAAFQFRIAQSASACIKCIGRVARRKISRIYLPRPILGGTISTPAKRRKCVRRVCLREFAPCVYIQYAAGEPHTHRERYQRRFWAAIFHIGAILLDMFAGWYTQPNATHTCMGCAHKPHQQFGKQPLPGAAIE